MEIPELAMDDFPQLETLNISYNKINFAGVQNLMNIKKLKSLDLTGNGLTAMPSDLAKFANIEELILTDNNLGNKSKETGCTTLLKSLG